MLPLLHHRRDKVCLVKPGEQPLKKYDMPFFLRGDGKYILHRIVAVRSGGYVIVGDNQRVREYPVLPSQVLGVVKGFWRNGRYISCENIWYRVYCRFWVFAYPARRFYITGSNCSAL